MKKRLQTILAHAGVASRRHAAELIENGKVKVNGHTVVEKGGRFDPGECDIKVNGRRISKEEKKHYFLFNKPEDVISTVRDTHDRKKVIDFFKGIKARLYPVGRLDKDTTGALVITNDGALAHRLSHPSFEIEKEYRVCVAPPVSMSDIGRLEKGIDIDGKVTSPCEIKFEKKYRFSAVYKVKLHEGRKRQIRLMFKAVGAKVTGLDRIKYAGLGLTRLKRGEFRALTQSEVDKLKGMTG